MYSLRSYVVPVFVDVAKHFERHFVAYLSDKAQVHEPGTELLKKTTFNVPAAIDRLEEKGELFTEVRTNS